MVQDKIIRGCCNKDERSYKALYEETIPYVYSIVSRYISNKEECKDQTQETYARVFQKIDSYDSRKGNFKGWLRTVCVNQCLSHLRKQKKLAGLNIVEISDINEPSSIDVSLDEISRKDIEEILKKMPQGYKMIFMLNVIDGYDHSEIQDLLGIKKETSRSQLARAKKWIQKNMNHYKTSSTYGLF